MGYLISVAEKFLDPENNPDYISMLGFPIQTGDIFRIIVAMNCLGIEIYKIEENLKSIYKSPLLQEIEAKRLQRRTQIKSK